MIPIVKINNVVIAFLFLVFVGCKTNSTSPNTVNKEDNLKEKVDIRPVSLLYFENQDTDYFIVEVDVNKDNITDKIVSSKPYKGNKLYFFLGKGKDYELALESVNFSEDGGNIIESISPSKIDNEILIICTIFPDRGNLKTFYHISYKAPNNWLLSSTTVEITRWQESKTFVCEIMQNINLKDFISGDGFSRLQRVPEDIEGSKVCEIKEDTPLSKSK